MSLLHGIYLRKMLTAEALANEWSGPDVKLQQEWSAFVHHDLPRIRERIDQAMQAQGWALDPAAAETLDV